MNISHKEQMAIIGRTADTMDYFHNSTDGREILCQMYCERMPESSVAEGRWMVSELIKWIEAFYSDLDQALQSPEVYLYQKLSELLQPLSIEEQCAFLVQIINELNPDSPLPETIPPASAELRHALLQYGIPFILDQDNFSQDNHSPERSLSRARIGCDMLLASAAMDIYTMAKEGTFVECPNNITMAQVVLAVCTENELYDLGHAKQRKWLPEENAQKREQALKAIFFILVLSTMAALVGGIAFLPIETAKHAVSLALGGYLLLLIGTVAAVYYSSVDSILKEEAEVFKPVILSVSACNDVVSDENKQGQYIRTASDDSSMANHVNDPAKEKEEEEKQPLHS